MRYTTPTIKISRFDSSIRTTTDTTTTSMPIPGEDYESAVERAKKAAQATQVLVFKSE